MSTDGAAIEIVFDEDLDTSGSEPATTAFDVTVDGGTPVNPANVAFHATDADTVVLTMSPAIAAGGTVTVAYEPQPTSSTPWPTPRATRWRTSPAKPRPTVRPRPW